MSYLRSVLLCCLLVTVSYLQLVASENTPLADASFQADLSRDEPSAKEPLKAHGHEAKKQQIDTDTESPSDYGDMLYGDDTSDTSLSDTDTDTDSDAATDSTSDEQDWLYDNYYYDDTDTSDSDDNYEYDDTESSDSDEADYINKGEAPTTADNEPKPNPVVI